MAIANYDQWRSNEKGGDAHGIFTTPSGVVAKMWKDWLYIEDATTKAIENALALFVLGAPS